MDSEDTKAPGPDNIQPSEAADSDSPQAPGSAEPQARQVQPPAQAGSEQSQQPEQTQQPQEQTLAQDGQEDHTALVRYGHLKMLGEFLRSKDTIVPVGSKVIIRTERGIEIGRIVLAFCEGSGDRGISRDNWQSYLTRCGLEESVTRQGKILRAASEQDLIDQRHLDQDAGQKLELCRQIIEQMKLDMKPVAVEHLFGGDRILFYFKSEKRVDFRKLVRRLAKEYQTRIEMRQVGARDEAKLLADYERCGRQCCCRAFLKMLAPVNMKMAKVQKATLDPAKISGRCGRLMCCLRYENQNYEHLRKQLPPRNSVVDTPEGPAVVVDRQILTQLVVVRLPDARRVAYPLAEITARRGQNAQVIDSEDQGDADPSADQGAQAQQQSSQDDSNNQSDRPGNKRRRRKNRRNTP